MLGSVVPSATCFFKELTRKHDTRSQLGDDTMVLRCGSNIRERFRIKSAHALFEHADARVFDGLPRIRGGGGAGGLGAMKRWIRDENIYLVPYILSEFPELSYM